MSPQRFVERSSVSSSGGACLLSVSSRGVAFRQVEGSSSRGVALRVERRGSASRGVAFRREE